MSNSHRNVLKPSILEKFLLGGFVTGITGEVLDLAPKMIEKGNEYGGYHDFSDFGLVSSGVAVLSLISLCTSAYIRSKNKNNYEMECD